jgi:hypothetical protein
MKRAGDRTMTSNHAPGALDRPPVPIGEDPVWRLATTFV